MSHKTGVLLVNLGSPSAPTPKAVRKYLFQFLTDRRIIELSPLLWRPILHGIVLRTRPAKSARNYEKIWDKDDNGQYAAESLLIEITKQQASALQSKLHDGFIVEAAMRYGEPSVQSGLETLKAAGCNKIYVLPMYPQYAGATTASVCDAVEHAQKHISVLPAIELATDYHGHPRYIAAVASSLEKHVSQLGDNVDKIIVSFHGLPKSNIAKGDPYEAQCDKTYELLCAKLPSLQDKMVLTYQSRFGPKKWLGPSTMDTLRGAAANGHKNVVVITPGFSADCLETKEEMGLNAKEAFLAVGGENFSLVPCLNADDAHIDMLADIVKTGLASG